MDAAKAAVSKITGRSGHRTDVDEVVNPSVTSETVKPHRHEETTEAVDREVHQHHFHTTVQPIQHKEVLPEKHTHNLIPQVEREFKNDNEAETTRRVSAELGQFQNTSTTAQTTQSTAAAPQVVGEHVHHHVHETVQPVIHKETVQPEVVHTTVPIHEVHTQSAQHHGMSALPMKTLDEFTNAGGLLSGNKSHTHEEYEGAPRPYNDKLKTTIDKVLPGHHGTSGTTGTAGNTLGGVRDRDTNIGSSGMAGNNVGGVENRNTNTGIPGSGITGTGAGATGTTGGLTGSSHNRPDSGVGISQGQHNQASLGDKINPRVDADRDGRAGIMD